MRSPCQWIVEVDDDLVADLGLDQRTREVAVVGQHLDALAVELDHGRIGEEIDLDDVRIGVAIDGHRSTAHLGRRPGGRRGLAGVHGGDAGVGRRRPTGGVPVPPSSTVVVQPSARPRPNPRSA
jgi:hypothetical protein